MRRSEMLVDRRIAALRRTDPMAAAALALRHRGVCPACGGRAQTSAEDAPSGLRHFRCLDCQWAASTTEERYRMSPQLGLAQLCGDAVLARQLAQELREKAMQGDRAALREYGQQRKAQAAGRGEGGTEGR